MKQNGTRSRDTKWQPFNQASNNDRNIHVPPVEEKEDSVNLDVLACDVFQLVC